MTMHQTVLELVEGQEYWYYAGWTNAWKGATTRAIRAVYTGRAGWGHSPDNDTFDTCEAAAARLSATREQRKGPFDAVHSVPGVVMQSVADGRYFLARPVQLEQVQF